MSNAVSLRPSTDADRPFLERVYAETRTAELARTGWTPAEKEAFCRLQFTAQDRHYREHYPDCEFLIVESAGEPIGRLYRDRRADQIRVVDIALLTKWRGRGIGGDLMRDVLREAREAGLAVSIHVERDNPARSLYTRLGFRVQNTGDIYDLLTWK